MSYIKIINIKIKVIKYIMNYENFCKENDISLNNNIFNENSKNLNDDNVLINLRKIIYDFTCDLLITFPELKNNLDKNLLFIVNNKDINYNTDLENVLIKIKDYCLSKYPEKFFDILYQNESIFTQEEELLLLPNIDFKILWKENISDKTRETIWKYLQLILFTIISDIPDSSSFGDTAKLFEAINEDEFKTKIEETINEMHSCFDISGATDFSNINMNDFPNADTINEHVSSMMNGKLGNLAKEIAEETAKDINIDMENQNNVGDVFQKLLKEPNKLMNLVQKVGGKLDEKIKSGELKESELLEEAGEIVNKMKNMPGMSNLQNMFNGMTGGNSKINVNAMQSHFQRNMKLAKQRERMKNKVNNNNSVENENIDSKELELELELASKKANEMMKELLLKEHMNQDEIEELIFSTGEKYKKSKPKDNPTNKKKKRKKKRNK